MYLFVLLSNKKLDKAHEKNIINKFYFSFLDNNDAKRVLFIRNFSEIITEP
jgi:hypothetical protein